MNLLALLKMMQAAQGIADEAPAFHAAPSEPVDPGAGPADIADILERISPQGQGGPASPALAPEAPEVVEDPQEVGVRATRLRRGLLGGNFRVGRTGGNILGLIGDALLTQGGRPAQYAPRLQERREAEAMQGFATSPTGNAEEIGQVNPTAGRAMWDEVQQASVRRAAEARQLQIAEDRRANDTNDRAMRLLQSANAGTYPALRDQVRAYFRARGVTPQFEIPETYDEAKVSALRGTAVPVDNQIDNEENRRYHDANVGTAEQRVGVSRQSVASSAASRAGTLAETRRAHDEQRRHNREMERIAAIRAARGGRRRPAPVIPGRR